MLRRVAMPTPSPLRPPPGAHRAAGRYLLDEPGDGASRSIYLPSVPGTVPGGTGVESMGQMRKRAAVAAVAVAAAFAIVGTASAANVTVEATGGATGTFDPENVTVRAGDTVTWKNTGTADHTVTSAGDDGAAFDRTIKPGASTTVTFPSAGTVDYFCRFHGTAAGDGMAGTVTVQAAGSGGRTTGRLAGDSRITTAIEISKAAFPNGATEVYLSKQDVNPDALVGGALTKGPILLVPSCGTLPPEVGAEIRRLNPSRVTALGGPNAVCDDMLRQAGRA